MSQKKEISNPFLRAVLRSKGFENVRQAAVALGKPTTTLSRLADIDPEQGHQSIDLQLDLADGLGIPVDVWMRGLVGRLGTDELAKYGLSID